MLRPWSKLRVTVRHVRSASCSTALGDSNADITDTPPPARGGPGGRLRPGPRPDASTDHHLCDNGSGLPLRRPGGRGAGGRALGIRVRGNLRVPTRDHGTFPRRSWRAGCSDESPADFACGPSRRPSRIGGIPRKSSTDGELPRSADHDAGKGVRKHLPDREAGTGRVHPGRRGHSRSPRHRSRYRCGKRPTVRAVTNS